MPIRERKHAMTNSTKSHFIHWRKDVLRTSKNYLILFIFLSLIINDLGTQHFLLRNFTTMINIIEKLKSKISSKKNLRDRQGRVEPKIQKPGQV
jgi:hypothetical protein